MFAKSVIFISIAIFLQEASGNQRANCIKNLDKIVAKFFKEVIPIREAFIDDQEKSLVDFFQKFIIPLNSYITAIEANSLLPKDKCKAFQKYYQDQIPSSKQLIDKIADNNVEDFEEFLVKYWLKLAVNNIHLRQQIDDDVIALAFGKEGRSLRRMVTQLQELQEETKSQFVEIVANTYIEINEIEKKFLEKLI